MNNQNKKWEVIMQYGKKIIVTDHEKQIIEAQKDKGEQDVRIGGQVFGTDMIKGIFLVPDDTNRSSNPDYAANARAFYKELEDRMTMSAESKAKTDMKCHVVPFWKLEGGRREDQIMLDAYYTIVDWLKNNREYPSCPSHVWMPVIHAHAKKQSYGKFLEILRRYDAAVEEWMSPSTRSTVPVQYKLPS